ncbi:MAG: hypothetical protein J6Y08_02950 [Clostridiales bacterium]|nr:hypothetical protein [Clostridiales bacterium]
MHKSGKLTVVSCLLACSLVLASCGHLRPKKKKNANAEAAVANYFKKLKSGDMKKAQGYVADSSLGDVATGEIFDEILSEYLPTLTYTLKSCVADDKTKEGTAQLELTCADLSEILDAFEGECAFGEFLGEVSAKKAPTRTETLELDLTNDGKWKIADDSEVVEFLFTDWDQYGEIFAEPTTISTETDPDVSTTETSVNVWEEASKDVSKEGWYSYDTEIYEIRPPASQYYEGVTSTLEYSMRFYNPYDLSGRYEFYDEEDQLIYSSDVDAYSKDGYGFLDCKYELTGGKTFEAGKYHLKIYIHDRLVRDEYTEVLTNNWEEVKDEIEDEGFFDYNTEEYVTSYTYGITDTIEYSFHFNVEAHVLAYFVLMDEDGNMIYMGVSATYYSSEEAYLDCTYSNDEEMIPAGHYTMQIYLYDGIDDEMIRTLEIDVVEEEDN